MRTLAFVLVLGACGGTTQPPVVAPVAPALPPPATVAAAPVSAPAEPRPPVAARRPHDVVAPAGTRSDPYYWLRDDTRKDPEMLAYLAAEQAYTDRVLAPVAALEATLFGELKARLAEDDSTVPTFDNGYWYYTRFEAGKQHPIYCRRSAAMTAAEQVLVDGNALAAGHSYYAIGDVAVSRDNKLVAWTDDTVGRRQYALHVEDLASGKLLADTATDIEPDLVWANDGKTVLFVGKDPTTLRSDRILRLQLGSAPEQVFAEPDGSYYVGIAATKSRRYLLIAESAETNTHYLVIDANHPRTPPREFLPRTPDTLYSLDHVGKRWVMRTNDGAKNFRVVELADGKQADRRAWKDVIPARADTFIEDVAVYDRFVAATIRRDGLSRVVVYEPGKPPYLVESTDAAYAMAVVDTPDPTATAVRYTYESLVRPRAVLQADLVTGEVKQLKQQPVPTYDASQYATEYVHATAADGTSVPISLVYKTTTRRDGTAPLLVYGYGSYGISIDPNFNSTMVSLLDRGWVYAIAHVRGGQELGRGWYDDGKLMHKTNTFTDYIAATEYLVAHGYGAKDEVFAEGGSAGGLLMGAVLNLRPDLYRGVAAIVPFVDVVTTMLDESIPLTTNEFTEWGNPKEPDAYRYMLSYSPYDNVKAQAYPAMFVHTGLWDSQVQYYEPTKWVAKLRATKTDANPLLLDIDMSSGHGGAAGRYDQLHQRARMLAFFEMVRGQPDPRASPRK
jgi:oligopeptidase B